MSDTSFDAIVIGSGMGGLTCASLLAQLTHRKVLLLERHTKLGGYTHSFDREGRFRWDVGLHYVGAMAPGTMTRKVFDRVTGGQVRWQPLPDPFQYFVYPGVKFPVPVGGTAYGAALKERFPKEAAAIDRYLRDIRKAASWAGTQFMLSQLLPPAARALEWLSPRRRKLAWGTTGAYLRGMTNDPLLRALLDSQWGDYGLPPGESAFYVHAMIVGHYLNGAWHPVGGAQTISDAAVNVLTQHGGEARSGWKVTKILVEGGAAAGVEAERESNGQHLREVFRAPLIISDAGARNTYLDLLPADVTIPFRQRLREAPMGCSVVALFVGFKESPAKLGIHGENYWIYDRLDHDETWALRNRIVNQEVHACFAAFGSLNDSTVTAHTGQILAFLDYEAFRPWMSEAGHAGYADFKRGVTAALIAFVDRHLPGYADLVEFADLATPLTYEHFSSHHFGQVYGIPATPVRHTYPWTSVKTPVKGLYLTGADTAGNGITGAMMAGMTTLAAIEGISIFPRTVRT